MERINLRYWRKEAIARLMPERFIIREIGEEIFKALETDKIVLLYGPRQGGKTSLLGWMIHKLLRQGIPPSKINYASMDFLDLHPLIKDTRRLVRLLREEAEKGVLYLFIDEIQRLENAGIVLKQIYDMRRDIRIVATGSSILKIREEVKEHLTGRKIELILYPFSFPEFLRAKGAIPEKRIRRYRIEEMEELIDLYRDRLSSLWKEYLYTGGYPEMVLSERRDWLYSSLFSTYLERDVGGFIRTANYQKFQDFVRLIATETGGIYNRESISRTLRRDSRTIERFEDILTVTFVLYRLTPFYTNIRRELSKMPRFYFIDTGFRNYLAGVSKKEVVSGALLENGVVSEAIKAGRYSLYWWRTKGGAEVDLIIKKGGENIPVEIKGIREEKPKLTRSFISFLNTYNPSYALFLTHNYVEKIRYRTTQVYFLPAYALGFLVC